MRVSKWHFLALIALLALSLSFMAACGDDDDDDDDDDDAAEDDDDATDDDDTSDPVDELIQQAYDACMQYWEACEYDDADTLCTDWVEAYRPAMEAYADSMDMDCMTQVMNDFFACVGEDCDPAGAWATCNAAVEDDMLQCFE